MNKPVIAVVTRQIHCVTLYAEAYAHHGIPKNHFYLWTEIAGVVRTTFPRGWVIFECDGFTPQRFTTFISDKQPDQQFYPDIVVLLQQDVKSFERFCHQRSLRLTKYLSEE